MALTSAITPVLMLGIVETLSFMSLETSVVSYMEFMKSKAPRN